MDFYDENFEDFEEYAEDIKDNNNNVEEIEDNKNKELPNEEKKEEKKEEIDIYKYNKEQDESEIRNINNIINENEDDNKNKEIKEIKSKQSTNKAYDVIENNKTIKIDLPPPVNIPNEKKNKITKENKITDKKFYINNHYHYSISNNIKDKNKTKNESNKVIINKRNNHNIIESKYSSKQPNQIIINNNRSNHQIIQIKETNKKALIRNKTMNEESQIRQEKEIKPKEDNKKNKEEFKNIQKYFNDFNDEYVKELEEQEQKKQKLKNNKSKKDIKENQINTNNIVLHNIKYINKNSNKNINRNNITNISQKNQKEKEQNNSNKTTNKKNINISQDKTSDTNKINEKINSIQNNTYKTITKLNSNNYKNIKVLGQGSYGKIYLVEDINTKEQYAMKKLILGDEFELKDNQDEYNMIMQICSTYPEISIIHVYATETKNFDQYNFVFYVLMEVAKCDWEKELLNRGKYQAYYTEEEIINILQNLVDTLAYLQQIGICHRDLKPQNILCFGEKGYKISDFGEAKFRKKWRYAQNPEGYTSMQTVRGTELYMSPLLYHALKNDPGKGVNHNVFKSDVFSLGMCFLLASCLDYKCLYDMRKAKNMKDVRNVVDKYVKNKYSNFFSDALIYMLNLNEKERPDFIELSNLI